MLFLSILIWLKPDEGKGKVASPHMDYIDFVKTRHIGLDQRKMYNLVLIQHFIN